MKPIKAHYFYIFVKKKVGGEVRGGRRKDGGNERTISGAQLCNYIIEYQKEKVVYERPQSHWKDRVRFHISKQSE